MYDVDAAEEWLESWTAGVDAQDGRAAALSRRVAGLTCRASSTDGAIQVTVGPSGQVQELELDDRVQRLAGRELARQILTVMRRAQAGLAEKVSAEVRDTVGADTETGRAVIHSFETRFPQPSAGDRDER